MKCSSILPLNTISGCPSAALTILISENGIDFKEVKQLSTLEINEKKGVITFGFSKEKAQYIKVIAQNAGKIPLEKVGAGSDAWLFVDEISVQ